MSRERGPNSTLHGVVFVILGLGSPRYGALTIPAVGSSARCLPGPAGPDPVVVVRSRAEAGDPSGSGTHLVNRCRADELVTFPYLPSAPERPKYPGEAS